MLRFREFLLIAAAVLIAAACLYKLTRPQETGDVERTDFYCPVPRPLFASRSQHRSPQWIKLSAYLSRHQILIVFFDRKQGAEGNPVLVRLRKEYPRLQANGVKVLGISTAIPQENRPPEDGRPRLHNNQPQQPFPFPLLTDLAPACKIHKQWGRYDQATNRPLTGVFLVTRDGRARCDGDDHRLLPLEDPDATIDTLLR